MSKGICYRCGSSLILASGYVSGIEPDAEPYESERYQKIETELSESAEYGVSLHICPRCGYIDDIFPDNE